MTKEAKETKENRNEAGFLQQKFKKRPIKEIMAEASDISVEKIAEEVLTWVTNNVEYFIDNKVKAFKLDLIVDSQLMSETKKLQDLYQAIPEENKKNTKEISLCKKTLDKTTEKIYEKMRKMKTHLEQLFKRMIFYYEVVALDNGVPLVKELAGAVDIMQFEYEAFEVGVKVAAPKYDIRNEDGTQNIIQGEEKDYVIPEGFTVWIEIAYKDALSRSSMF